MVAERKRGPNVAVPVDFNANGVPTWRPENIDGSVLGAEAWGALMEKFFRDRSAQDRAALRTGIVACIADFMNRQGEIFLGVSLTDQQRASGGNGALSPIAKMVKSLQDAADAWQQAHGDPIASGPHLFDQLRDLAAQATKERERLARLPRPVMIAPPWHAFVRNVAQCCRVAGMPTPRWGHAYDEDVEPPEFYHFMCRLKEILPPLIQEAAPSGGRAFWQDIHSALPRSS